MDSLDPVSDEEIRRGMTGFAQEMKQAISWGMELAPAWYAIQKRNN